MDTEFLTAAAVIAFASPTLANAQLPHIVRRKVLRWLLYLIITFIIGHTVGRPWSFVWVLGAPLAALLLNAAVRTQDPPSQGAGRPR